MHRPWISIITTLLIACWEPAAAQAPSTASSVERIVYELQLLRKVLDRQISMSIQLELIRGKLSRLSDLQRHVDTLAEERELDEKLLRELHRTRQSAPEEDRPGIDQNILDTDSRITDLRRREALLQSEMGVIEQKLDIVFRLAQTTEVGQTPRN